MNMFISWRAQGTPPRTTRGGLPNPQVALHWRQLRGLLTLLVALSALLVLQPVYAHSDVVAGVVDGTVVAPVEAVLSADRAPKPGEVVNLLFQATPHLNAPEVTITWVLPDGGELLGGPAKETLPPVASHQSVQISRQIRFASAGVYKVAVSAQIQPLAALGYGGADVIYFIVNEDGTSSMTRQDPNAVSPMRTTMETTIQQTAQPVRAAQANDDPCFNISGNVSRIERKPTSAGYAPDVRVPVRFALIQMREEDPISDDVEDEALTDANGDYSFSFCDNDGFAGGDLELYVRLYASLYEELDGFEVVYIEDSSWIDEMYEYDSPIFENGDGGTFEIDMELDINQSGPFNIADAIYGAWRFWKDVGGASGGDDAVDITAEVHWEPGYVESDPSATTFYEGAQEEITIGSNSNDDDTWDDSPIIHEYGHMIEDNYSCDESLGGPHSFTQILNDPEFAWSEGYQNYFQSAVRQAVGEPNANLYIDINVAGTGGAFVDLETWDVTIPNGFTAPIVSQNNEISIAALFWDLLDPSDTVNDGQDSVEHGQAMIQEVYTDDEFNDQWGDEECTVNEYFRAWQALDKPADTGTAAVVTQNTGVANPFTVVSADASSQNGEHTFFATTADPKANQFQWWKHLIMIPDLSSSMAGPKIDAVKTVLNEQVNDIAQTPKGVEFSLYSFDNTKNTNQNLLAGKFYANLVTPAINGLNTNSAADPNCPVESLRALNQAIGPKIKGDAWLFTDGDALQSVSVETVVQSLNSHQIKGSIALLGGCNTAPVNAINTSGATKNYLGLAANASQSGGIVPYLLTAIGSGGQFLYVDPSKINDATEILRAQLSHSAGAGRWSDYVSDTPTYLYDKLPSWEYAWIDTSVVAGGTNYGTLNSSIEVALPSAFSFYGSVQTMAHVARAGYLTFGPTAQSLQLMNQPLPAVATPNNALYIMWDDLFWNNPPALVAAAAADGVNSPNSPDAPQVNVFSRQVGEWFAIATIGNSTTNTNAQRAYQVLLNATTGEIRYQYKSEIDTSTATIGLENAAGTGAVQVSHNDISGATDNMGYKFTPAPAQPSKTFTVPVDSLMSSVGFLLSGYSGSFDPLVVRTPDNSQISCADSANVLCLNLGFVQYVQVKVNGRVGVWQATVSAGATGAGTFSFSSIGASTLTAESNSVRARSTGVQTFALKLERPVTGNVLDGWFAKPNGFAFGSAFHLYDDGLHDDGAPGDGRFGSDGFTPPAPGVAYLQVKGNVDGVDFTRSEPAPFNFQPLQVNALGDGVNYGDVTALQFLIKNDDSVAHCYDRTTTVPAGWLYDWHLTQPESQSGLCLDPGASTTRTLEVKMAAATPNTLPSAASGEVLVAFVEREEGMISASAMARVTRHRPPALIEIGNQLLSAELRPTGVDTATLAIFVYDEQMVSVPDGVEVQLSSSLGTITPATAIIRKGRVDPIFAAGTVTGDAVITAIAGNVMATTTIAIRNPIADVLNVVASAAELPAGVDSASLTATVRDGWDNPVANETVRLSVAGDGEMGTLNGSEVMTATTDANGQVVATFARGMQIGNVMLLAELVTLENNQSHVALTAHTSINVLGANVALPQKIYLPVITR